MADPDPNITITAFMNEWIKNAREVYAQPAADLTIYTTNAKYRKLNKRRQKIMLGKLPCRKFTGVIPTNIEIKNSDLTPNQLVNVEMDFLFSYQEPEMQADNLSVDSVVFNNNNKTPTLTKTTTAVINVNDKKVAQVFIDSVSVSRGTEPPSLNETTTLTIYTDGTKDIKKESN